MNMTHRITPSAVTIRLRGPALLAIALLLPCTWGLAQDEDDAEPGPGPARPAAQPAAPAKPAPKLDLRFEPPAIRSVLEGNPTTPKELIRAVETLVDLRRPELAKPFLKQLLDTKPDAKTLIALAGEFGSASFLKFAHNPDLAPEGAQLADAVLSAAEAARTEPAMLVKLVTQLSAADRNTREDAIVGLFKAQQAAVVPLVRALMDPARAREQQAVRSMLVRLGGYAVPPLVAMLESRDPTAKLRAAEVLGRLRAKEAVPGLLVPAVSSTSSPELKAAARAALNEILGRVPSDTEAIELLRHDARAALQKVKFERADTALSVERWRWDDKLIQSVLVQLPPADAAALDAARLAGDAYMLQADAETGRLFILAQLTAAKLLSGLDHPLAKGEATVFAQIAAFGPDAVEAALATALAEGQFTAATGAVEILADIGREDMLYRSGPALSPLAEAARSNDRRLRFAATDAILQLKPTRPFAGAAAIPQNLAFFAGTSGFRRAIVGHARREPGQQVVSLLSALDYEADGVTSAREFFNLASQSPDYELGFIHVSLDQSGADELLARLAPRSAHGRFADRPDCSDRALERCRAGRRGSPCGYGRAADANRVGAEVPDRPHAQARRSRPGQFCRAPKPGPGGAPVAGAAHRRQGTTVQPADGRAGRGAGFVRAGPDPACGTGAGQFAQRRGTIGPGRHGQSHGAAHRRAAGRGDGLRAKRAPAPGPADHRADPGAISPLQRQSHPGPRDAAGTGVAAGHDRTTPARGRAGNPALTVLGRPLPPAS